MHIQINNIIIVLALDKFCEYFMQNYLKLFYAFYKFGFYNKRNSINLIHYQFNTLSAHTCFTKAF
jgi:hypothetical protein